MKLVFALICMAALPALAQYHAGSNDCDPYINHEAAGNVEANDGFDQHGSPVAAADMNPSRMAKQFENSNINLDIPVTNYVDPNKYNVDLSKSRVKAGTISVMKDGSTALNGEQIKPQNIYSTECK